MSYIPTSKINVFETSLQRLARILSGKHNVKVHFVGNQCCTNGNTILLPALTKESDQSLVNALPGCLDHEIGHILYSNFKVFKEIKHNQVKLESLVQLLEDGRIERKIINKWRGSRYNLEKTYQWAFDKVFAKWDKLSLWKKVTLVLGAYTRDFDDSGMLKEIEKRDLELIKQLDSVKDTVCECWNANDSFEILELAKRLLKELQEEEEEEQQKDQDSLKENTKQTLTDVLDPKFEPDRDQLEKDNETVSLQKLIEDQATQDQQAARRLGEYLIYSTENDILEKVKYGNKENIIKLIESSRHITNAVRAKLIRSLLSVSKVRWESGKVRGNLDSKSLFRLTTGRSKKIFKSKIEAPHINTRCSLWVDHSGSMKYKIELAAQAAILFGEVLSSLSIPFEICGYSTTSHKDGKKKYYEASRQDQATFTRWGNMWIGVYKEFEDNWKVVRHHCAYMQHNYKENTYDGEVLKIAASRLLQYPEQRRILFLFNDGEPLPNIANFIDVHRSYLKQVVTEVEKHIEVFAVGMGKDNNIAEYYSNCIDLIKFEDLSSVVVTELDRLLRKNQNAYMKRVA